MQEALRGLNRTKTMKGLRYKLCVQQSWKCYWCSIDLHEVIVELDHVMPRSVYGETKHLVAACKQCNQIKSARHFHGNISKIREFILAERSRLRLDIELRCPDGIVRRVPNF